MEKEAKKSRLPLFGRPGFMKKRGEKTDRNDNKSDIKHTKVPREVAGPPVQLPPPPDKGGGGLVRELQAKLFGASSGHNRSGREKGPIPKSNTKKTDQVRDNSGEKQHQIFKGVTFSGGTSKTETVPSSGSKFAKSKRPLRSLLPGFKADTKRATESAKCSSALYKPANAGDSTSAQAGGQPVVQCSPATSSSSNVSLSVAPKTVTSTGVKSTSKVLSVNPKSPRRTFLLSPRSLRKGQEVTDGQSAGGGRCEKDTAKDGGEIKESCNGGSNEVTKERAKVSGLPTVNLRYGGIPKASIKSVNYAVRNRTCAVEKDAAKDANVKDAKYVVSSTEGQEGEPLRHHAERSVQGSPNTNSEVSAETAPTEVVKTQSASNEWSSKNTRNNNVKNAGNGSPSTAGFGFIPVRQLTLNSEPTFCSIQAGSTLEAAADDLGSASQTDRNVGAAVAKPRHSENVGVAVTSETPVISDSVVVVGERSDGKPPTPQPSEDTCRGGNNGCRMVDVTGGLDIEGCEDIVKAVDSIVYNEIGNESAAAVLSHADAVSDAVVVTGIIPTPGLTGLTADATVTPESGDSDINTDTAGVHKQFVNSVGDQDDDIGDHIVVSVTEPQTVPAELVKDGDEQKESKTNSGTDTNHSALLPQLLLSPAASQWESGTFSNCGQRSDDLPPDTVCALSQERSAGAHLAGRNLDISDDSHIHGGDSGQGGSELSSSPPPPSQPQTHSGSQAAGRAVGECMVGQWSMPHPVKPGNTKHHTAQTSQWQCTENSQKEQTSQTSCCTQGHPSPVDTNETVNHGFKLSRTEVNSADEDSSASSVCESVSQAQKAIEKVLSAGPQCSSQGNQLACFAEHSFTSNGMDNCNATSAKCIATSSFSGPHMPMDRGESCLLYGGVKQMCEAGSGVTGAVSPPHGDTTPACRDDRMTERVCGARHAAQCHDPSGPQPVTWESRLPRTTANHSLTPTHVNVIPTVATDHSSLLMAEATEMGENREPLISRKTPAVLRKCSDKCGGQLSKQVCLQAWDGSMESPGSPTAPPQFPGSSALADISVNVDLLTQGVESKTVNKGYVNGPPVPAGAVSQAAATLTKPGMSHSVGISEHLIGEGPGELGGQSDTGRRLRQHAGMFSTAHGDRIYDDVAVDGDESDEGEEVCNAELDVAGTRGVNSDMTSSLPEFLLTSQLEMNPRRGPPRSRSNDGHPGLSQEILRPTTLKCVCSDERLYLRQGSALPVHGVPMKGTSASKHVRKISASPVLQTVQHGDQKSVIASPVMSCRRTSASPVMMRSVSPLSPLSPLSVLPSLKWPLYSSPSCGIRMAELRAGIKRHSGPGCQTPSPSASPSPDGQFVLSLPQSFSNTSLDVSVEVRDQQQNRLSTASGSSQDSIQMELAAERRHSQPSMAQYSERRQNQTSVVSPPCASKSLSDVSPLYDLPPSEVESTGRRWTPISPDSHIYETIDEVLSPGRDSDIKFYRRGISWDGPLSDRHNQEPTTQGRSSSVSSSSSLQRLRMANTNANTVRETGTVRNSVTQTFCERDHTPEPDLYSPEELKYKGDSVEHISSTGGGGSDRVKGPSAMHTHSELPTPDSAQQVRDLNGASNEVSACYTTGIKLSTEDGVTSPDVTGRTYSRPHGFTNVDISSRLDQPGKAFQRSRLNQIHSSEPELVVGNQTTATSATNTELFSENISVSDLHSGSEGVLYLQEEQQVCVGVESMDGDLVDMEWTDMVSEAGSEGRDQLGQLPSTVVKCDAAVQTPKSSLMRAAAEAKRNQRLRMMMMKTAAQSRRSPHRQLGPPSRHRQPESSHPDDSGHGLRPRPHLLYRRPRVEETMGASTCDEYEDYLKMNTVQMPNPASDSPLRKNVILQRDCKRMADKETLHSTADQQTGHSELPRDNIKGTVRPSDSPIRGDITSSSSSPRQLSVREGAIISMPVVHDDVDNTAAVLQSNCQPHQKDTQYSRVPNLSNKSKAGLKKVTAKSTAVNTESEFSGSCDDSAGENTVGCKVDRVAGEAGNVNLTPVAMKQSPHPQCQSNASSSLSHQKKMTSTKSSRKKSTANRYLSLSLSSLSNSNSDLLSSSSSEQDLNENSQSSATTRQRLGATKLLRKAGKKHISAFDERTGPEGKLEKTGCVATGLPGRARGHTGATGGNRTIPSGRPTAAAAGLPLGHVTSPSQSPSLPRRRDKHHALSFLPSSPVTASNKSKSRTRNAIKHQHKFAEGSVGPLTLSESDSSDSEVVSQRVYVRCDNKDKTASSGTGHLAVVDINRHTDNLKDSTAAAECTPSEGIPAAVHSEEDRHQILTSLASREQSSITLRHYLNQAAVKKTKDSTCAALNDTDLNLSGTVSAGIHTGAPRRVLPATPLRSPSQSPYLSRRCLPQSTEHSIQSHVQPRNQNQPTQQGQGKGASTAVPSKIVPPSPASPRRTLPQSPRSQPTPHPQSPHPSPASRRRGIPQSPGSPRRQLTTFKPGQSPSPVLPAPDVVPVSGVTSTGPQARHSTSQSTTVSKSRQSPSSSPSHGPNRGLTLRYSDRPQGQSKIGTPTSSRGPTPERETSLRSPANSQPSSPRRGVPKPNMSAQCDRDRQKPVPPPRGQSKLSSAASFATLTGAEKRLGSTTRLHQGNKNVAPPHEVLPVPARRGHPEKGTVASAIPGSPKRQAPPGLERGSSRNHAKSSGLGQVNVHKPVSNMVYPRNTHRSLLPSSSKTDLTRTSRSDLSRIAEPVQKPGQGQRSTQSQSSGGRKSYGIKRAGPQNENSPPSEGSARQSIPKPGIRQASGLQKPKSIQGQQNQNEARSAQSSLPDAGHAKANPRSNMKLARTDVRSSRSDIKSSRTDLRSSRADIRSSRPDLRSGNSDANSTAANQSSLKGSGRSSKETSSSDMKSSNLSSSSVDLRTSGTESGIGKVSERPSQSRIQTAARWTGSPQSGMRRPSKPTSQSVKAKYEAALEVESPIESSSAIGIPKTTERKSAKYVTATHGNKTLPSRSGSSRAVTDNDQSDSIEDLQTEAGAPSKLRKPYGGYNTYRSRLTYLKEPPPEGCDNNEESKIVTQNNGAESQREVSAGLSDLYTTCYDNDSVLVIECTPQEKPKIMQMTQVEAAQKANGVSMKTDKRSFQAAAKRTVGEDTPSAEEHESKSGGRSSRPVSADLSEMSESFRQESMSSSAFDSGINSESSEESTHNFTMEDRKDGEAEKRDSRQSFLSSETDSSTTTEDQKRMSITPVASPTEDDSTTIGSSSENLLEESIELLEENTEYECSMLRTDSEDTLTASELEAESEGQPKELEKCDSLGDEVLRSAKYVDLEGGFHGLALDGNDRKERGLDCSLFMSNQILGTSKIKKTVYNSKTLNSTSKSRISSGSTSTSERGEKKMDGLEKTKSEETIKMEEYLNNLEDTELEYFTSTSTITPDVMLSDDNLDLDIGESQLAETSQPETGSSAAGKNRQQIDPSLHVDMVCQSSKELVNNCRSESHNGSLLTSTSLEPNLKNLKGPEGDAIQKAEVGNVDCSQRDLDQVRSLAKQLTKSSDNTSRANPSEQENSRTPLSSQETVKSFLRRPQSLTGDCSKRKKSLSPKMESPPTSSENESPIYIDGKPMFFVTSDAYEYYCDDMLEGIESRIIKDSSSDSMEDESEQGDKDFLRKGSVANPSGLSLGVNSKLRSPSKPARCSSSPDLERKTDPERRFSQNLTTSFLSNHSGLKRTTATSDLYLRQTSEEEMDEKIFVKETAVSDGSIHTCTIDENSGHPDAEGSTKCKRCEKEKRNGCDRSKPSETAGASSQQKSKSLNLPSTSSTAELCVTPKGSLDQNKEVSCSSEDGPKRSIPQIHTKSEPICPIDRSKEHQSSVIHRKENCNTNNNVDTTVTKPQSALPVFRSRLPRVNKDCPGDTRPPGTKGDLPKASLAAVKPDSTISLDSTIPKATALRTKVGVRLRAVDEAPRESSVSVVVDTMPHTQFRDTPKSPRIDEGYGTLQSSTKREARVASANRSDPSVGLS